MEWIFFVSFIFILPLPFFRPGLLPSYSFFSPPLWRRTQLLFVIYRKLLVNSIPFAPSLEVLFS